MISSWLFWAGSIEAPGVHPRGGGICFVGGKPPDAIFFGVFCTKNVIFVTFCLLSDNFKNGRNFTAVGWRICTSGNVEVLLMSVAAWLIQNKQLKRQEKRKPLFLCPWGMKGSYFILYMEKVPRKRKIPYGKRRTGNVNGKRRRNFRKKKESHRQLEWDWQGGKMLDGAEYMLNGCRYMNDLISSSRLTTMISCIIF